MDELAFKELQDKVEYLEMLVAYLLRHASDGTTLPYHMAKFMEKN